MISFQSDGIDLPDFDIAKICRWLTSIASSYSKVIGNLDYMFCTDEAILNANRNFLNHDYYTDIITFDYSEGNRVGGDVLISLDTVASNAETYGVTFSNELYRVIVHGLLHLCGLKDKTPQERSEMEAAENKALKTLVDYDIRF